MARSNLQYLIGQEIKEPEHGIICGYTASDNLPVAVTIHYIADDGKIKHTDVANVAIGVSDFPAASDFRERGGSSDDLQKSTEETAKYPGWPFGPRAGKTT